jgi:hypothetical protein
MASQDNLSDRREGPQESGFVPFIVGVLDGLNEVRVAPDAAAVLWRALHPPRNP